MTVWSGKLKARTTITMMDEQRHERFEKRIYRISIIIAVLATAATLGGLFLPDSYQDGPWYNAQWYGQDAATLILDIPALMIALGLRRQPEVKLILAALLAYFVYNYAFYGFVAKFNDLYLLHVAILSLSVFGLIFQLRQFDTDRFAVEVRRALWVKAGAAFALFVSVMLAIIWMQEILSHMLIENYRSETPTGEPGTIIFTLDLGFVIPVALYGAIRGWQQRYWGLLLLGFALVLITVEGFALLGMAASLVLTGFEASLFLVILWSVLALLGLGFSILYLRSIDFHYRTGERKPGKHRNENLRSEATAS